MGWILSLPARSRCSHGPRYARLISSVLLLSQPSALFPSPPAQRPQSRYLDEARDESAPFFLAAQRAFMDAANFARPSGVSPPFFLGAVFVEALTVDASPRNFAQRAFAAPAIRARPSGVILRLPGFRPGLPFGLGLATEPDRAPPRIAERRCRRESICSLNLIA